MLMSSFASSFALAGKVVPKGKHDTLQIVFVYDGIEYDATMLEYVQNENLFRVPLKRHWRWRRVLGPDNKEVYVVEKGKETIAAMYRSNSHGGHWVVMAEYGNQTWFRICDGAPNANAARIYAEQILEGQTNDAIVVEGETLTDLAVKFRPDPGAAKPPGNGSKQT